ncbi:MAG: hypothetical protein QXL88_02050 [Candidatus Pacearchaeota archaeon]
MFGKKIECLRCGKKVSSSFKFCPFCGSRLYEEKDSLLEELDELEKMKLPFLFKFPMKKLMKQLAKELEEISELEGKSERPAFAQGFSISITNVDGKPIIKVSKLGAEPKVIKPKVETKTKQTELKDFSKKDAVKYARLKKIEPKTKVRRLADKVVYEFEIPGVEKDKVIINHLGNTIEIKALAKNKAYFKVLPVALPIKSWYTEEDKLILELEPE